MQSTRVIVAWKEENIELTRGNWTSRQEARARQAMATTARTLKLQSQTRPSSILRPNAVAALDSGRFSGICLEPKNGLNQNGYGMPFGNS
eukprot:940739-Pyramimonas_sp.AAC.1